MVEEIKKSEKRSNPEELIRPQIRGLKAYESKPVPDCVKLDANENPFPWPRGMKDLLFKDPIAFNRYPDGGAAELKQALSRYTQIPAEGILTGNGSDELIQLIMTTFGGERKAVVLHPPTFSMYWAAAKVTGTDIIEVPLQTGAALEVHLDVEGILQAAARPEVHIIILCNPNNPTGSLYPREDLLRIIKESGKIVVVDEAYTEFSGETVMDQIPNYPNLIVMRTFSKAFGMAALRLGYLLGQPSTIELLNRARQPFNVNSMTQRAGVLALQNLDEYKNQIQVLVEETQKIYEALKSIAGVRVYPTRANFILFQPEKPEEVYQELIKQGFLVRNMGSLPVIGKALRLSAGLPEENGRLIGILKKILA
jgi:histidinol-phosphate aminotransferase